MNRMKRCGKTAAFVLSVILLVFSLANLVLLPWDAMDIQFSGFYAEPSRSLDVVFIGASDMYSAFSPCKAFEEQGFTSYLYCLPRNSAAFWKTQVEEILSSQTPQLVVIEINGALYTDELDYCTEENLHLFTDHMPSFQSRERLIRTFVPQKDRAAYFFPYLKYHGNLSSFAKTLRVLSDRIGYFSRGGLLMHGERGHFGTFHPKSEDQETDLHSVTQTLPMEPVFEEGLRDFLAWAAEENPCPVLFLRTPHFITQNRTLQWEFFLRSNRVEEIVREYGFPILRADRLAADIGIDSTKDYYDPEHLNISGQQKFTGYLSRFLAEEYGVRGDGHTEETLSRWADGVRVFHSYIKTVPAMPKEERKRLDELLEYESSALIRILKSAPQET